MLFILRICLSIILVFFFADNIFAVQDLSSPEFNFEISKQNAEELSRQWNRDSATKAADLYLKISSAYKNTGDRSSAAVYLRKYAFLKSSLGELNGALPRLAESLELEKKSRNPDGEAESAISLSLFHAGLGNFKESDKYLKIFLALEPQIAARSSVAETSFLAGEVYFAREDIQNFLKYYSRALESFRAIDDRRGAAKTLFAMSYAKIADDDLSGGLNAAKESLEIWNQIGDRRGITLSLSQLGVSQFRLGSTREALQSLRRAEELFPPDIDKTERAILAYNIGRIYEGFADCDLGIDHFKTSLDLLTEEQNESYLVGNLWSLGAFEYRCGKKDNAIEHLNRSLELARKLDKNADIIHSQIELGNIYLNENDLASAKSHFENAFFLLKRSPYNLNSAKVYAGLAKLAEKRRDIPAAAKNYAEALKTYRAIKDDFSAAEMLYNLARIEILRENPATAADLISESVKITDSLSSDVINSKLKDSYFSTVYERYELLIHLLMESSRRQSDPSMVIEALQVAEKSRARAMTETLALSGANFTKDADAKTLLRERELRSLLNLKSDRLTDLLGQNALRSEVEKLEGEISRLEHELEEISSNLKQNSPAYSAVKDPPPFDVVDFQKNVLDENSVLLEFSLGERESYLWIVEKNAVRSVVLPPRSEIESNIEKLRELIAARVRKKEESIEIYQARVASADREFPILALHLSKTIFGDSAESFEGKRLIVVPDGKLHYFPISALPLPDSVGNEPMMLSNEVVYEPSAMTLGFLQKLDNASANDVRKDLLVFSDPVFSSDDVRFSGKDGIEITRSGEETRFVESLSSLTRLKESKAESDSIVEIVGEKNADVYTGFSANREELLNISTSGYKIIHFATHGYLEDEHPELSGIVLSRFGPNREKLEEFFRLQDIYGMKLRADLVVLSACETGIGKEVKGEGLKSLNNAFLQVGAKTVVSSLWQVEDSATGEFMKIFYETMLNGEMTASKALQITKQKMRENRRFGAPYYWAGFTIQGDFNRKPEFAKLSGENIYYAALALLVFSAIIGSFYLIRKKFGQATRRV